MDKHQGSRKSLGAKMPSVEDARASMGTFGLQNEFNDLFTALKNMLMCLSFSKQASIRSKVMKIIKKLI